MHRWVWLSQFNFLSWLTGRFSGRSPLWSSLWFLWLLSLGLLRSIRSIGIVVTSNTFFRFSWSGSIVKLSLILLEFNIVLNGLLDSTFMIAFIFAALSNRPSTWSLGLFHLTYSTILIWFLLRRLPFWPLGFMFWGLFSRRLFVFSILGRARNHPFLHIVPFPFHPSYFLFILILLSFKLIFHLLLLIYLPIFIELSVTETFMRLILGFFTLKA